MNTSQKPQLPDCYANVPHAELGALCDIILKKTDEPVRPGKDKVNGAVVKDEAWIAVKKNTNVDNGDTVTWAGFNSSLMGEDGIKPRAVHNLPGLGWSQWEKNMKDMSKLFLVHGDEYRALSMPFCTVPTLGWFPLYVQAIDDVCDYASMCNQMASNLCEGYGGTWMETPRHLQGIPEW